MRRLPALDAEPDPAPISPAVPVRLENFSPPRHPRRFGPEPLPVRRRVYPSLTPRPLHPVPCLPGWVVEELIARGPRADVYRVRSTSPAAAGPEHRVAAAKVFRGAADAIGPAEHRDQHGRIPREVVALRRLEAAGCEGVPRVLAVASRRGDVDVRWRPWYVMPYYAGGAMWTPAAVEAGRADRWAEPYRANIDRVLDIVIALAGTLAAMHDAPRPIVHGGMTAANVYLAAPGGPPVLGGFALALLDDDLRPPLDRATADETFDAPSATSAGLHVWRAPELDARGGRLVGPPADVFMLGGLLYQTLTGGRFLPPAGEWDGACVHDRPGFTVRSHTDDPRARPVEALLERMLTRDPARRLPAREIVRMARGVRSLPPVRAGGRG